MKLEGFDKYYEAPEPGRRERAYAWTTAIGLQDVDGLKPSKYLLATAKRHIEGEISQEDACRLVDNALVRANYENDRLGVEKTQLPLEAFFKALIYGDEIELHNRFLKIGQEYGSPIGEAVKGLHRRDDVMNRHDVGINVGINLTPPEATAIKELLRNPKLTAPKLGGLLNVTSRQAERIIASLKQKAGLKRRGARKNGEWYFESGVSGQ